MKHCRLICALTGILLGMGVGGAFGEEAGLKEGKVRVTIEGDLGVKDGTKEAVIFSLGVEQRVKVARSKVMQHLQAKLDVLQGVPKEMELTVTGEGEIKQVTGELLQD